uniref:Ymf59 n=1 Tax=Ichthyophthirius multifiliis TaxID=5932 RepID=G1FLC7_ICHMU|nr:Ymf59 [Ichthyophthirius multifiliis]AEL89269.1 Ymf59 [Ichthyophthirius multifiliis]
MYILKKEKIIFNIKYKMNFKPKFNSYSKLLKNTQTNFIFCRNFIFLILIVEYLLKVDLNYNRLINFKYSLFFKKYKKNIGSIIRAPYKNKTSQFKLKLERYYLFLIFSFNIPNKIQVNSQLDLKLLLDKIIKPYKFFESTLITQDYRKINIPIEFKIIN